MFAETNANYSDMGQLPTCFLIGDSISVQYSPYLEKCLEGIVKLNRKEGDKEAFKDLDIPRGSNGGDSKMVLDFLREQLKDSSFRPDYFLFNFGLHDIKHYPPNWKIQIELKDYKCNLTTIIQLLKGRGVKPVWIRTTPVVDTVHNSRQKSFKRYDEDLTIYNHAADRICWEEEIPFIDLYAITVKKVPEHYIDHVHYYEVTRLLQATYIAKKIQEIVFGHQKTKLDS